MFFGRLPEVLLLSLGKPFRRCSFLASSLCSLNPLNCYLLELGLRFEGFVAVRKNFLSIRLQREVEPWIIFFDTDLLFKQWYLDGPVPVLF